MNKLIVMLVWLPCLANAQQKISEQTGTFPMKKSDPVVVVDNVFGAVKVKGVSSNEVSFQVTKQITGTSQETLAKGNSELNMKVEQRGDSVVLFLSAPYICSHWEGCRQGNQWDGGPEGYDFQFDVVLEVPTNATLNLRTVDKGDLQVEGVHGKLHVSHVNGTVKISDAVKLANARSVNGDVWVYYHQTPQSDANFSTINGQIQVYTAEHLNARVAAKSMNGQLYTSFTYQSLSPKLIKTTSSKGNQTTYKIDESFSLQVGEDGPQLSFETLNGDMYLRKL